MTMPINSNMAAAALEGSKSCIIFNLVTDLPGSVQELLNLNLNVRKMSLILNPVSWMKFVSTTGMRRQRCVHLLRLGRLRDSVKKSSLYDY